MCFAMSLIVCSCYRMVDAYELSFSGKPTENKEIRVLFFQDFFILFLIFFSFQVSHFAEPRLKEFFVKETPFSYDYCWDNYTEMIMCSIFALIILITAIRSIKICVLYKSYKMVLRVIPLELCYLGGYCYTFAQRIYIEAEDRVYLPMIIYNCSLGIVNVLFTFIYV